MPLPTLISEYSGKDEAGHVFDVTAHMPAGVDRHDVIAYQNLNVTVSREPRA